MTKFMVLIGCVLALTAPCIQAQENSPSSPNISLAGHWLVTVDELGETSFRQFDIVQQGEKISGTYGIIVKFEGTVSGNKVHFLGKWGSGGTTELDATLQDDVMVGSTVVTAPDNPTHPRHLTIRAIRIPERPSGPPKRLEFVPTVFYREFSAHNEPVLTIAPGDTVHTTTVDAGGADEHGVARVAGGNPQTGPFYITSTMPGDILVVHLVHLKLNRDYAVSDDDMVPRSLNGDLSVTMKDGGKTVIWHLDRSRGVAHLEKPGEHLTQFSVPLHPMLGCIATAPDGAAPPTQDSGYYGGNMDFNEVVEGATVYLPVLVPGALLYLGDAHAVQGDGELNGNALETSLDVEFSVDVISKRRIAGPMVESGTHLMAMGLAGSLDDAFREATASMAQWLIDEYGLTPAEIAEVLGSSAEYKVSEVADRNAGVVLKLNKDRLSTLTPKGRQ